MSLEAVQIYRCVSCRESYESIPVTDRGTLYQRCPTCHDNDAKYEPSIRMVVRKGLPTLDEERSKDRDPELTVDLDDGREAEVYVEMTRSEATAEVERREWEQAFNRGNSEK